MVQKDLYRYFSMPHTFDHLHTGVGSFTPVLTLVEWVIVAETITPSRPQPS